MGEDEPRKIRKGSVGSGRLVDVLMVDGGGGNHERHERGDGLCFVKRACFVCVFAFMLVCFVFLIFFIWGCFLRFVRDYICLIV